MENNQDIDVQNDELQVSLSSRDNGRSMIAVNRRMNGIQHSKIAMKRCKDGTQNNMIAVKRCMNGIQHSMIAVKRHMNRF